MNNEELVEKLKIVNYRPLTVVFLSMIVGIILSIKLASVLYLLAILLSIFIVEICRLINKSHHKDMKLRLTRVILFATCFGMILGLTQIFIQQSNVPIYTGECQGRIKEISISGETAKYYCEDFTVDGEDISGNVVVEDSIIRDLAVGDFIRYDGKIEKLQVINQYRINSNYLNNNITYSSEIENDIDFKKGSPKLAESIRISSLNALRNTMSEGQAGISYAMLFGDTALIEDRVLDAFQISGISHMFAVSGLHIGIFYGFFAWLFTKMRLSRNVKNPLVLILVCYYTYICGSTPSSVRATIMVMVFTLAEYVKTEIDQLSSLSMAGIVVLLINPFSCFTVGFSLSFIAVLSLISIGRTLNCTIKSMPYRLRNTLAPIIAIQILTVPIVSHYFGYVSMFSPIVNMFLIPVVSIIYIYNIITLVIYQLIGLNLLQLSGALLGVITNVLGMLSQLKFAQMNISFSLGSMMFYYPAIFVASDYYMVRKKTKVVMATILLTLSFFSLIL